MCPVIVDVAEQKRLNEAREAQVPWKKWGPYLSERQWGTVREDYSDNGDAWNYFTHDHSRSRAYRWGEDGLGGLCDDQQRLCFALALWNERDPILKERLFGLTNSEGNHGEDVKEYYFYLDSTPTHSYMKYLYKYPQREYPYRDLIETNRTRSREEMEYELLDTGVFNEDRYFDVFVEYAKADPEDILVRIIDSQPRTGSSTAARLADTLVPQHMVDRARTTASLRSSDAGPGAIRASASRSGRLLAPLRRCPGIALHRKREQCTAPVEPAQRVALCQGCVPRLRHLGTARRGESRQDGDQGRGPLRMRRTRRRQHDDPVAPDAIPTRRRLRQLRAILQQPPRRCGRILRAHCAQVADRRSAAGCTARRWPECCGANSTTTSISTTGCASTGVIRCSKAAGATCATRIGSTC